MQHKLKTQIEIAQKTFQNSVLLLSKQIERFILFLLSQKNQELLIDNIIEIPNNSGGLLSTHSISIDEFGQRALLTWRDTDNDTFIVGFFSDEDISIQNQIFEHLKNI